MDGRLRLLKIDEEDPTPFYMQLANHLMSAIEDGQWKAGEALPPERTLVEALGISRVTARRALLVLEEQGTIRRNRGAGTFVAPRFRQSLSRLGSFSSMVHARGYVANSELIGFQRRRPSIEESTALQLGEEDEVVVLTRLRKVDETVISLQESVLPYTALPDIGKLGESLYRYLDEAGKPIQHAVQHFRAATANEECARLLKVPVGEPLLLVTRIGFTHDESPVEFTRTFCTNEHHEFVVELTRKEARDY
jgi:GntR family transcriptional regulator